MLSISYTMTGDKLLRFENVSKIYQKHNIKIKAISDVSFYIEEGEFVSIIGKSGCGKSTLLNLAGGLDHVSSGQILFNSSDLAEMKRDRLAAYRLHSVGFVFQSFNLIHSQTALENVGLAMMFSGYRRRHREREASRLLSEVGLENRLGHTPSELSGGECQRVSIARALANNPKLLIADEPTGNLDTITSGQIMDLLCTINRQRGISILMVTHDAASAFQFSNKVIQLSDGVIVDIKKGLKNPETY